MQEQLNLAIPELKGYGVPSELEPQFWIRELRILSKWGPEKDSEIRRVVFRKGLNVSSDQYRDKCRSAYCRSR